MGLAKEIWEKIAAWAHSVSLVDVLITVIVGVILYKISGFVIQIIVNFVSRGLRPKESKREHKKRLKTLSNLFTTLAKISIVLSVIFSILTDFHINLVPLFASAGVAGVALGFGAQSIVRDVLAGFFLILENQYRVGDFVELSGTGIPVDKSSGTVEKLSVRSTVLRDRDGNVHFVPNGSIVQAVNKTKGYSKVHFMFAVGRYTDTENLIKLVNELGKAMAQEPKWREKIIDPPHFNEVGKIGKEGFNVTITGMTEPADQWKVSSEFRRRLVIAMRQNGIETEEVID